MNKPRTLALKIAALMAIMILLNLLATLSQHDTEWWTGLVVITSSVCIIIALVILFFGKVVEHHKDDDNIID